MPETPENDVVDKDPYDDAFDVLPEVLPEWQLPFAQELLARRDPFALRFAYLIRERFETQWPPVLLGALRKLSADHGPTAVMLAAASLNPWQGLLERVIPPAQRGSAQTDTGLATRWQALAEAFGVPADTEPEKLLELARVLTKLFADSKMRQEMGGG